MRSTLQGAMIQPQGQGWGTAVTRDAQPNLLLAIMPYRTQEGVSMTGPNTDSQPRNPESPTPSSHQEGVLHTNTRQTITAIQSFTHYLALQANTSP